MAFWRRPYYRRLLWVALRRFSIGLALLGCGLGAMLHAFRAPTFRADMTLLCLARAQPGPDAVAASEALAYIVQSEEATQFAIRRLGLDRKLPINPDSPAEVRAFRERTLFLQQPDASRLVVETRASSGEAAKALCAAYWQFASQRLTSERVRNRAGLTSAYNARLSAQERSLRELEAQIVTQGTAPAVPVDEPLLTARGELGRIRAERQELAQLVAQARTPSMGGALLDGDSPTVRRYRVEAERYRSLLAERSAMRRASSMNTLHAEVLSSPKVTSNHLTHWLWMTLSVGLMMGALPFWLRLLAWRSDLVAGHFRFLATELPGILKPSSRPPA